MADVDIMIALHISPLLYAYHYTTWPTFPHTSEIKFIRKIDPFPAPDTFTSIEFLFICDLGTNFHPTTASISFLHLFWISIDSRNILYFASSSFFSLSPAAGCTTVAGGVISCMISQSAFAGSWGRSRIAAKRPNIAAPSTTDVACECGSITGMLHVFASRRMSAMF